MKFFFIVCNKKILFFYDTVSACIKILLLLLLFSSERCVTFQGHSFSQNKQKKDHLPSMFRVEVQYEIYRDRVRILSLSEEVSTTTYVSGGKLFQSERIILVSKSL